MSPLLVVPQCSGVLLKLACWQSQTCVCQMSTFLRLSLSNRVAFSCHVAAHLGCALCPAAAPLHQPVECGNTCAVRFGPQFDTRSPSAPCAPLQGAITWLETQLKHSDMTLLMVTHDRTFMESVCTGWLMLL